MEDREPHRISTVRLGQFQGGIDRCLSSSNLFHLVRVRAPQEVRVVDNCGWDLLSDDAVHDLGDHPLLDDALGLAVVRRELVAQPPVGDQSQTLREESPAVCGDEPVHADVVAVDVLLGGGQGRGDPLQDRGGHAVGEAIHHSRAGPRLAVPSGPIREAIGERVDREVEQREVGDLRLEQVLISVNGEVDHRQPLIDRRNRSGIEIERREDLAAHLVEVSIDLLQNVLETGEGSSELHRVDEEVGPAECGERRVIAVLRPPALGDLRHAESDAHLVSRAELLDQLRDCRLDRGRGNHRLVVSRLGGPRGRHRGDPKQNSRDRVRSWHTSTSMWSQYTHR